MINNFFKVNKSERNKFCENVINTSTPSADFYFLVILSAVIVSSGIINNNLILIIGGMLVTPILSPILAISLGFVITNLKVIFRSVRIFLFAFAVGVMVSYIEGLILKPDLSNIDIIGLMDPNFFAFFVAVVAGIAASYSWVKPDLNATLPGIAITVTLIPPLSASGIALAVENYGVFKNAIMVLGINVLGIILASAIVMFSLQLYKTERKVLAEVKEEEKELKKTLL